MLGYLQNLTDLSKAVGPDITCEPLQSLLSTFRIIEKICMAFTSLLSTAADLPALSIEQKECISWLADSGNMCVICWLQKDQITASMQIKQQVAQTGVMPALAAALTAMHAAAMRCAPKPLDPGSHELAAALLSLWNPLMVALQSPTPVGLLCPLIGPTVAPAANLAAALMRSWQGPEAQAAGVTAAAHAASRPFKSGPKDAEQAMRAATGTAHTLAAIIFRSLRMATPQQAAAALAPFEELHMLLCLNLARVAGQLHLVNKGKSYLTSSSSSSSSSSRARRQQQRPLHVPKFHEQLYDAIGMPAAQKETMAQLDLVVKQVDFQKVTMTACALQLLEASTVNTDCTRTRSSSSSSSSSSAAAALQTQHARWAPATLTLIEMCLLPGGMPLLSGMHHIRAEREAAAEAVQLNFGETLFALVLAAHQAELSAAFAEQPGPCAAALEAALRCAVQPDATAAGSLTSHGLVFNHVQAEAFCRLLGQPAVDAALNDNASGCAAAQALHEQQQQQQQQQQGPKQQPGRRYA
ncbi:hypothetical protein OEZ86_004170 [Tetradesmus obliquus]|nr:hypothetical protein OEZ86_004170 [Tetradesmus obliquus]